MTVTSASIKTASKKAIKNNIISSITVTVLLMSVWFMCYNISAVLSIIINSTVAYTVFAILIFFLFSPLVLGFLRYFWRLLFGQTDKSFCIFYYFTDWKNYFRSLRFLFSVFFRIILGYLIFSVPVFALKLITGTWLYSFLNVSIPIWTANLSNIISFLKLIAFAATFFYVIKFYLSAMLFVADENMDIAEALHLSTVISRRTRFDFIFFVFSFLGWILLSLLTIPLILTLPYMIISYLIHCSYDVEAFNEEITKINQDDIPTFVAGV